MRARTLSAAVILLLSSALAASASGCDLVPRKVTDDDCKRWNEHNAEVLKREFAAALKKCDPARVDSMTKVMEEGVERGMASDVDSCKKQAAQGARVIPKEVDCFMKGGSLADWKACNFTMPTFRTETLQIEVTKVEDFCTKGAGRKGEGAKE
jgi:hypothetical protein